MEIEKLPKQHLLQIKRLLEKYFYNAGTNIALKQALGRRQSSAFRSKVVSAIKNQILNIAQLDTVLSLTKKEGSQVENHWQSFVDSIPGGQTTIMAFLLWAGDQGGQAGLDKMIPNAQFNLQNMSLIGDLQERATFLIDSVDKTGINWADKVIQLGVSKGLSAIEIVKQMRLVAPRVAQERGDVITENELVNAMNIIEVAVYKKNNIEKVKWITSEDERVCEVCVANENAGEITLGDVFPSGHISPEAHILCRCFLLPVLPYALEGDIWSG